MPWSKNFKGQSYASIKRQALKSGELFTDPEFPANSKSLFFSKVDKDIVWKRPMELVRAPRFVQQKGQTSGLAKGPLGNTWFTSSCSALCHHLTLWNKVIPDVDKQELQLSDNAKYAGVFKFQLWRFGQWMEVVVDDQLPTKDGELVFCHSKNEFWTALLEKAYAKIYGDYESLNNLHPADALVDFTGGVPQKLELNKMPLGEAEEREMLFNEFKEEVVQNKALALATIPCPAAEFGAESSSGLLKGCGYGVIDVKYIKLSRGMQGVVGQSELRMVRLRNPWAPKEWTGAWSNQSPEWKLISEMEKKKLGLIFTSEEEFWMSFDDFLKHFSVLDLCHFVNTSIFSIKKSWNEAAFAGEWKIGTRDAASSQAGGCYIQHPNTFLSNPQYMFDVTDEQGDMPMFCLEQEDSTKLNEDLKKIGFHIMKVEVNRRYRAHVTEHMIGKSDFLEQRAVFVKTSLEKGRYVIVPACYDEGTLGRFYLRFYTSKRNGAKVLLKDQPTSLCPCIPGPSLVTVVTINRVSELPNRPKKAPSPQLIIRCEGESVKTNYVKEKREAEFDTRAIFYRKKPSEPIEVELVSHGIISDDFMGLAQITDACQETEKQLTLEMFGKKKKERETKFPGKIHVTVQSRYDLSDL